MYILLLRNRRINRCNFITAISVDLFPNVYFTIVYLENYYSAVHISRFKKITIVFPVYGYLKIGGGLDATERGKISKISKEIIKPRNAIPK